MVRGRALVGTSGGVASGRKSGRPQWYTGGLDKWWQELMGRSGSSW